ncbi:MAG: helix-turn-helix domain-containing protein [Rhodospirillaceae bacterium]|jgi:excisionase family DNA binding protein|nr:helix-turn-helix domain-containing protein [Rhodospirillaceae bacterium]MBT5663957.1 helix-turn-helix domain-containing protein [Rhodospirillaceae bacterium]
MKTANPPVKLAYGIADAVQATSVGRSSLYEEIRAGRLKTFKIGTRTLIAAESLNAWLATHQAATECKSPPNSNQGHRTGAER